MTSRRRVIANISMSLDGRVSGAGGDVDMSWIVPHAVTDTAREQMQKLTEATTVLLGRKNYEGFGGYWPTVATDETADPRDRNFAQWLDAVEKVVVSSTLEDTPWQNSRVVSDAPPDVAAKLRTDGEGDIVILASVSVIQALMASGDIDRLIVNLCPEIVGGGRPLFAEGSPRTSWALSESSPSGSGSIYLTYDKVGETEE